MSYILRTFLFGYSHDLINVPSYGESNDLPDSSFCSFRSDENDWRLAQDRALREGYKSVSPVLRAFIKAYGDEKINLPVETVTFS